MSPTTTTSTTASMKAVNVLEKKDYMRNWFAFCIMGTLNNLGYVIVGAAAQSICDDFDEGNLLGLISWANVGVGFFVRVLNTYLEGQSFKWRIILNGVFMVLGFSGLVISKYISFWFALFSILFVGGSSSFGESATLAYIGKYPPELVAGWSSGTGWAGVGGSGLYLALVAMGLSDQVIFGLMIPTVFIYWFAFFFVLKPPVSSGHPDQSRNVQDPYQYQQFHDEDHQLHLSTEATPVVTATTVLTHGTGNNPNQNNNQQTTFLGTNTSNVITSASRGIDTSSTFIPPLYPHNNNPMLGSNEDDATTSSFLTDPADVDSVTITIHSKVPGLTSTPELPLVKFKRCCKLIGWWAVQLCLVYFFEYYIQTGGADKANKNVDDSNNWEYKNSYALLAVCYQVGVLISRSSLNFFKVRIVEIITVLQGLNFVVWLLQDSFKLFDVWIQFVLMVYVGLLGGLSYVNTFYLILNSNFIPKKDKEYCINLVAISINIGIVFSAGFTLLAENTWLVNE